MSRSSEPNNPHFVHMPLQMKSSTISLDSKPPPNETPQQKVARLRAAAQKARAAQVSTFDTVLDKGRRVADKAHRIFNYSLLAASVVGFCVGTYAFVDLSLYKRRRNKEWEARWREESAQAMANAYDAVQYGTATEAQREMVEKQLAYEAEQERKKNQTWKQFFFGSLQKEESQGGTLGISWKTPEDVAAAAGTAVASQSGDGAGVAEAVEDAMQKKQARRGGVLDQLADNAANAAADSTKTWTSWFKNR